MSVYDVWPVSTGNDSVPLWFHMSMSIEMPCSPDNELSVTALFTRIFRTILSALFICIMAHREFCWKKGTSCMQARDVERRSSSAVYRCYIDIQITEAVVLISLDGRGAVPGDVFI